jgi:hypothetical protein
MWQVWSQRVDGMQQGVYVCDEREMDGNVELVRCHVCHISSVELMVMVVAGGGGGFWRWTRVVQCLLWWGVESIHRQHHKY